MAKITGNAATRKVFIDGEELKPGESLKVRSHSPDGFAWGYGGSGPAQLALAILMKYSDSPTGTYQDFKNQVIGRFPKDKNFVLDSIEVLDWIEKNGTENCKECDCRITKAVARKFEGHCETCNDRLFPDSVPEDERPGANKDKGE